MVEKHAKKLVVEKQKSRVPMSPQSFPRDFSTLPLPRPQHRRHKKLQLVEQLTLHFRNALLLLETDCNGMQQIVLANPAFEKAFGFSHLLSVGKAPDFLFGAKSDPGIVCELQEAIEKRLSLTERLFIHDKAGQAHWVEAEIYPLANETDGSEYMAFALRPIAEGDGQTDDACHSGERFSQAFEYGPIGMALVAPDGQWLTLNRQLCDLLGYSAEELCCKTSQQLTHPDDLATELSLAAQAVRGVVPYYQIEKRYVHKDGHIVWAHLTASLIRDNEGHPLYFIQQVQNITESKRATERIAQQAALLDKTHEAIVLFSLEGEIQFWNKGAEAIYGWTCEEALGQSAPHMTGGKDEQLHEKGCRATLETGHWTNESTVAHKDGREVVVESHWTLIRDSDDQPKAFLVISHDIGERKLMESQLMRAQRMESIGTLAGGIAHDLNNILTPIMMSIEMLRCVAPDPKAQSIIETISSISRRGADIVRQVLSFARGMKGQHVEVQPRHLLKDIQAFIKETLPKNIQLKNRFPNDSWTLQGDPTQLHQIIMNLCVNARDAMPNGGCLTITTENVVIDAQYASMHLEATPGKYLAIVVSDTGTGIPPEILDKIFDPFFTTKEIGKGTGLGLSTVISIVKSHHGFVHVDTEVGKGTTFKIHLPALGTSSQAAAEDEALLDLPRGNGETVLMVDDESSILTITGQTLEAFGYKVLTAGDGAEALARYAEHRDKIAVVLTDMAMPVLDGPATIRVLMKMNPAIRIIAASGLKSNGSVQETNPEVKFFIEKPYTAGTLLKMLRDILAEVQDRAE
jgi:PAS domain S-box-containing protein